MRKMICQDCGREYEYSKAAGHAIDRCNSCVVKRSRHRRKEKAVDYLGGKCVRCGYDACIAALQFHHKDCEEKDFNISHTIIKRWSDLKEELDKCELLCANCHAEEHYTGE